MAEYAKPQKRTTPLTVFIWPKLVVPDTKFKAGGELSTKAAFDTSSEFATKLRNYIDKEADKALAAAIAADKRPDKKKAAVPWKLAVKPYEDETDKEGNETGRTVFKFATNASGTYKSGPKTGQAWTRDVKMFDSLGQPCPKGVDPWGGTEGAISYTITSYAMGADVGAGVKLNLEAVQITKLVKGGDRGADDYGFAKQDDGGFTADDAGDDDATTDPSTEGKPDVAAAEDDF